MKSLQQADILEWLQALAPNTTPAAFVGACAPLFLGVPYGETTNEEELTLSTFDCVTLIETILALRTASRIPAASLASVSEELRRIRFDAGIANYASRRHYFTDWLAANEVAGMVANITKLLGGKKRKKTISWMSKHPDNYPALREEQNLKAILARENRCSQSGFFYLPKESIRSAEAVIQQGDIIAFTSNKRGLDVAHCGMVLIFGGRQRLFHASSKSGKVEVSRATLATYAQQRTDIDGIIVARMR